MPLINAADCQALLMKLAEIEGACKALAPLLLTASIHGRSLDTGRPEYQEFIGVIVSLLPQSSG